MVLHSQNGTEKLKLDRGFHSMAQTESQSSVGVKRGPQVMDFRRRHKLSQEDLQMFDKYPDRMKDF